MSAEGQTKILADYIMANVPGEPSRDEGAGTCAVRLLKKYRDAFSRIVSELGVPNGTYPAPVANAYEVAKRALTEGYEVFGVRVELCDELTASEALFGFVGWLTTRSEETVFSGHHDAGAPADLVGEFMKANQLSEPRDGWQHRLARDNWQYELPEIKEGGSLSDEPEVPRELRWRLYNLAFRVLGNTRWWPALGRKIWG